MTIIFKRHRTIIGGTVPKKGKKSTVCDFHFAPHSSRVRTPARCTIQILYFLLFTFYLFYYYTTILRYDTFYTMSPYPLVRPLGGASAPTHSAFPTSPRLHTFGTNSTTWGTEYCVCREKAVSLHRISERGLNRTDVPHPSRT